MYRPRNEKDVHELKKKQPNIRWNTLKEKAKSTHLVLVSRKPSSPSFKGDPLVLLDNPEKIITKNYTLSTISVCSPEATYSSKTSPYIHS